jgi:type IV secretory pathway component VirB8
MFTQIYFIVAGFIMANQDANEAQEIAQMIRSGRYFSDAREWYATVYISQIADRAFFFVVLAVAAVIAFLCIGALGALTPIVAPRFILLSNTDIDKKQLSIYPLRGKEEAMDAAMRRFFISAYVISRESYQPRNAEASKAFVLAHSDPLVAQGYAGAIAPGNPDSLPLTLGNGNERTVEVASIIINDKSEPPVANIVFITHDTSGDQVTSVQRRATLAFYYTPLTVKEVVDKDSGDTIIQTEEPQFQVIQYEKN